MITERELMEAIAECRAKRNPDANTCIMLASFYTILDHMKSEEHGFPSVSYSPSPSNAVNIIDYEGNSEFADVVHGRQVKDVMPVIEELMETLKIVNPRLYDGVLRRL